MALLAYTLKSISEHVDRETGAISYRLNVVEALPRVARLNLANQSASFINELRDFVGKSVALDVRDGVTSSGFQYTSFVNETLLPVDLDYLAKKHAKEIQEIDNPLNDDFPEDSSNIHISETDIKTEPQADTKKGSLFSSKAAA